MAYYWLDNSSCIVYTRNVPLHSAWQFFHSVIPNQVMNVNQFVKLYGNILIVPTHCKIIPPRSSKPSQTTPPLPKVPHSPHHTEPPEEAPPVPPAPPCDPPAPIDKYASDSGFSIEEHWNQPVVAKLRGISLVADMDDDDPILTTYAELRKDENNAVRAYKKASGPGWLALLPPESNERHVYGDKGASGTNSQAALPDGVSKSGLLLLSYADADGETGKIQQVLAWGKVVARADGVPRPASGWYAILDNANGDLCWQSTDAAGNDINTPGFKVNGSVVGGGGTGDFLADGTVPMTGNLQLLESTDPTVPTLVPAGGTDTGIAMDGTLASEAIDIVIAGVSEMRIEAGKVTIPGLLDPTGLEFEPVAANPGGTAANTLWQDSGASDVLKHGANLVVQSAANITNDAIVRGNGGAEGVQLSGLYVADVAGSDARLHANSVNDIEINPNKSGFTHVGDGRDVDIDGGKGTVSNGDVNIGATDADAVNIGRSGIDTTVSGRLVSGFVISIVSEETTDFTAAFGTSHYMTSGSSKTGSMPNITTADIGKIVEFVNRSGSSWTLDGDGADTIEGSATISIPDGATMTFRAMTTSSWRA